MTSLHDRYERFLATSRAEWRAWLEANHREAQGIWLITYKKQSGKPVLPYEEAVEEALCFGWIDSRPAKLDDERTMLLYTPRKKGSGWSRVNKERIERLTAAGVIAPAGMAKIEAAKLDGSWARLDASEAMLVPDDLRSALMENLAAQQGFDAFSKSVRKQLLAWIDSAKRAETREKRIAEVTIAAAEGRNPLQWRPKGKS
jgi:uncharacterized protein YdeI (YjbR/CyaY-like superfamily)